jgi:hypothetical protein
VQQAPNTAFSEIPESPRNLFHQEGLLSHQLIVRRGLVAGAVLFLLWLAWQALSGGFRQLPRSRTAGQKVETVVQLQAGLLSALVALTCFWGRRWAQPLRILWSAALAVAAGLSALVWGPPMPLIGALFVAVALLISRAVQWALRTGFRSGPRV